MKKDSLERNEYVKEIIKGFFIAVGFMIGFLLMIMLFTLIPITKYWFAL